MRVRRKRKFGNQVCPVRLSGKQTLKWNRRRDFRGGGDGLPVHFSVKGRFCQRALGRKSLKLHCSPGKASLMETLELRLPSEELHVRKE